MPIIASDLLKADVAHLKGGDICEAFRWAVRLDRLDIAAKILIKGYLYHADPATEMPGTEHFTRQVAEGIRSDWVWAIFTSVPAMGTSPIPEADRMRARLGLCLSTRQRRVCRLYDPLRLLLGNRPSHRHRCRRI